MREWTFTLCLAIAGILALGTAARAQTQLRVSLADAITVGSVGDTCVTAEAIVTRVAHWLGRDAIEGGIDVRVLLDETSRQFSFVLQRGDEPVAQRVFDVLPSVCGARIEALSLAIAIAIDPSVMDSLGEPAEELVESTDEAQAQAQEEAEPLPLAEPPSAASGEVRFGLAAGVAAQAGFLPELSFGGSVSGELLLGPTWQLRLSGWATSNIRTALGRGEGSMRLVGGRFDVCFGSATNPLQFGGCVGAAAGALLAEGLGFETDLDASSPWVAAIARVFVLFPAHSLFAGRLAVDALLPLLRPGVHIMDTSGGILDEQSLPLFGAQIVFEALFRFP